jgi:hypothetical protein
MKIQVSNAINLSDIPDNCIRIGLYDKYKYINRFIFNGGLYIKASYGIFIKVSYK